MNRNEMIDRLEVSGKIWDMVIIGGGATGLGVAIDAASRGYHTLLVEQGDFGQGTSSRSTKLVHGGVRYLQQGNITLVLEALKERGILRENAPHLVHNLPFIVPNYDWWEGPFYGIGLKVYDLLAGKHGFGKSQLLSREKVLEHIPTLEPEGLNGGVIYYDGQFDDARLVINMAQTAAEQGAVVINYMQATELIKKNDVVSGIILIDRENEKEYQVTAKVFINATGAFTDQIRMMDEKSCLPMIQPSQGVHLVLNRSFLPGDSAIMVPHTDDGRVLFAIPWHNRVIVGTTDTPVKEVLTEPRPQPDEIEFLLSHAARYLTKDPVGKDILSIFAGIRPLVGDPNAENTAALSRDHVLSISRSGLVTITGGKWTTYRKMAEDSVDHALLVGELTPKPCVTENLNIHGYHKHPEIFGAFHCYGSDAIEIQNLMRQNRQFSEKLHPGMNMVKAEVVWAVREEMAKTVDDFLSRRRRALILDARKSLEIAPIVSEIMQKELGKNRSWRKKQIDSFTQIAERYIGERLIEL